MFRVMVSLSLAAAEESEAYRETQTDPLSGIKHTQLESRCTENICSEARIYCYKSLYPQRRMTFYLPLNLHTEPTDATVSLTQVCDLQRDLYGDLQRGHRAGGGAAAALLQSCESDLDRGGGTSWSG